MKEKNKFIPGGYCRKDLKGYIQYNQFKHPLIFVDKAKGANVIIDEEVNLMLEKNLITSVQAETYFDTLNNFFDFEKLSDYSDEQVLYKVFNIKETCFKNFYSEKLSNNRGNTIKKELEHIKAFSSTEMYLKYILKYPLTELKSMDFEIEFSKFKADFKTDIDKGVSRIILFIGDYKQIPGVIKFFESLMDEIYDVEIIFMVKDNSIYEEPALCDMKYIISNLDKDMKYELFHSECYGIDLNDKSLIELRATLSEKDLIFFIGENMLTTSEGADFNYYVISEVKSDKAAKYTGLYPVNSEDHKFIIKKIPFYEYEFEKKYHGAERNTYSLNPEKWGDKRYFINYYSPTFDPDKFPEFIIKSDDFDGIIKERDELLSDIAQMELAKMDGEYINCYYDLKKMEKTRYFPGEEMESVLVKGVKFNSPEKVILKPILAQDMGVDLVDFRSIMKKQDLFKGTYFLVNFLYFATSNIKNLYNSIRGDEREKLTFENFFIDYYKKYGTTCEETVPLYNKAIIEYKKSKGGINISRKNLGKGKIRVNAAQFEWESSDVNSSDYSGVKVYTPMLSNGDIFDNFRVYGKNVGAGRYNIVIVDNKIICIKYGEVSLPSLGVVISLNEEEFARLNKVLKLKREEKDYFSFDKDYYMSFELGNTFDDNELSHGDLDWMYGGAFQMIGNGENLVKNKETSDFSFEQEGWFAPLSMQTQETQVQKWVRGPRSVMGTDKNGAIFAVTFSGRTRESKGVRFDEIVNILENEIGDIKDMVNLDGGASSCLGMVYKDELFELNYPSMTMYNSAGMIRPLNSLLLFGKK